MCGICGIIGDNDLNIVKKMCKALYHRGPDSEGYYEDDQVTLGVRRLRIIDLLTGDQPIHNEDSSIWIVFNGEIYNFLKLRNILIEKGHEFYTKTDTEVLIHLYEEYNENMLNYINGMFSFAIYDSNKKILFLARDRFGEKPLYYTINNNNFIFSSELKGILSLEGIKRRINKKAMAYYLHYFYNPLEESFIEGIYRLPPSCYIKLNIKNKEFEIKQYWDLKLEYASLSEEEAIEHLDIMLNEQVRTRLISEVPIGVLLSGGVDSSIIAALAKKYKKEINAFTIIHDYSESEEKYAKIVAEKFDLNHKLIEVKVDALKTLDEIIKYIDEPLGDPSIIPTYLISESMKKFVTVCLTGEGGDEGFWGYPWLSENDMLDKYFKLPKILRKAIKALSIFPRYKEIIIDLNRYEKLNYDKLNWKEKLISRISHFTKDEINKMINDNINCSKEYELILDKIEDVKKAKAYLTIKKILPNDFLHKDDRLSMAHSLEFRSPFLDHVLFEKLFTWPNEFFNNKLLLKKYAYKKIGIPKEVIFRKKIGFTIPIKEYYKEIFLELKEKLNILNKYIKIDEIKLIKSYEHSNRSFALLVLAKWLDYFEIEQN